MPPLPFGCNLAPNVFGRAREVLIYRCLLNLYGEIDVSPSSIPVGEIGSVYPGS
jgi:hypothetical protein